MVIVPSCVWAFWSRIAVISELRAFESTAPGQCERGGGQQNEKAPGEESAPAVV